MVMGIVLRLRIGIEASASSELRSTVRQIQSKSTEFVCPSSTRPPSASSELRSTVRQIQSKSTDFVCPSSTRRGLLARNCARQSDRLSQKVQSGSRQNERSNLIYYPSNLLLLRWFDCTISRVGEITALAF